eukprot:5936659-Pyramimonas_sp.AAC.1
MKVPSSGAAWMALRIVLKSCRFMARFTANARARASARDSGGWRDHLFFTDLPASNIRALISRILSETSSERSCS